MKCPVCTATDLVMSERSGIEIDYCPQCRGVWLDRGELDKIIERSIHAEPSAQAAGAPHRQQSGYYQKHEDHQRNHHDHDSHGRPYHRKKSFWHELFD